MERRFQINYSDGKENIVWVTDSAIATIKRKLSKKNMVGTATIFDRKTNEAIYYKPRYHHRSE